MSGLFDALRASPTPETKIRRVVLVGFMGSGKSTVGRLVAERLGWRFIDFDEAIERREGRSVAEIFADSGEKYFRAVESDVGSEHLTRTDVVLATGGGWAARPGRLDALPEGTCTVWLRVNAETAVARARSDGGPRPLLETEEPVERARSLLTERTAYYSKAEHHLDTGGVPPDELAETIVDLVNCRDGAACRSTSSSSSPPPRRVPSGATWDPDTRWRRPSAT